MSIKINKQLNRPDGGFIESGSLVSFKSKLKVGNKRILWYYLSHYINHQAINLGKQPITSIEEFNYKIPIEITEEQESSLDNESFKSELLKKHIESIIGVGYVNI